MEIPAFQLGFLFWYRYALYVDDAFVKWVGGNTSAGNKKKPVLIKRIIHFSRTSLPF
jgi:hypothetical protein